MIEAEPGGDGAAPVTALGEVAIVSKNVGHELGEQRRHFARPHGTRRLSGEAEARQRGGDDVEGVARIAAEALGMSQRLDDLDKFRHRSGPAVGNQQRQRRRTAALLVNEMDVDPFDRRGEV